jgi:hypothetical protein
MSSMSSISRRTYLLSLSSLAVLSLLAAGCGSGTSNSTSTGTTTGSSFVIGTDAPMASVTSFSVAGDSVNAIDRQRHQRLAGQRLAHRRLRPLQRICRRCST